MTAIAGAVAPVFASRIIDPGLLDLYVKTKSGKLKAMDYYIQGAVQLEDLETKHKFIIFPNGPAVIIRPNGEARTMNRIERALFRKITAITSGRAVGYEVDRIKKQIKAKEQEEVSKGEGLLTTINTTIYEA